MKSKLAVSDALFLKPLLYGLDKQESPFELVEDIPANNSVKFSQGSGNLRTAFLSPIDYARHGAEFCILPNICASTSQRTDTIQLYVKNEARSVRQIAVDVRVTSEIVLAKIILSERFKSTSGEENFRFLPMLPDVDAMLKKADAALIVNSVPTDIQPEKAFVLDLVEEWSDMTGLPYVHGFWVGREEELEAEEAIALLRAKEEGTRLRNQIADHYASKLDLSLNSCRQYFSSFDYAMGEKEQEGLSEFIRYAFYLGALADIPDLRFFEIPNLPHASLN